MSTRKRVLPRGWYPSSASECNKEIDRYLAGFVPPAGAWRGGIAPHAGWFFSGRAAARVLSTLASAGKPDRVVLYGGHLHGGAKPITYTDESWETPFGLQPLDKALAENLISLGEAVPARQDFVDNTVEIQLPFVSRFFPGIPVLAVHSPASSRAIQLGEAVNSLLEAQALSAIFIGSADLTHYGPNYGFTPKGVGVESVAWVKEENDRLLIERAINMDSAGVLHQAAANCSTCSPGPIASVITSVGKYGIKKGRLLEYYTSYDITPDSSFVGYAAIIF